MKAAVVVSYTDRITGDVHFAGSSVELTAERARELSDGGFVKVDGPIPDESQGESQDVGAMTMAELRDYIEEHGSKAPAGAKKADLLRIAKAI